MLLNEKIKYRIVIFLLPLFIVQCGSCSKRHAKPALLLQDSAVYSSQNYSELQIDSVLISSVVLKDSSLDSFYSIIHDFYERRNFQSAWYTDSTLNTQAHNFISRLRTYIDLYGDNDVSGRYLIFSGDTVTLNPTLNFRITQPKPLIDILLTAAFFKYASHEYYGTTKAPHDLEWYIPRKKKNYLKLLNALITSDENYASYEPITPYYTALKRQLLIYRKIENAGGLPFIASDSKPLKKGDTSLTVTTLKKYLRITRDYILEDTLPYFTDSLSEGLRNFQERMGLPVTKGLDKATLHELNTSIKERIRQIMINMERLRWAPDSIPENYLLVNIPDFKLHVMQEGKGAWSMNIIVGKDATGTSIFSGSLRTVVFRPYWVVPQSIIVKEILPILKRNPGYLLREHMEVLSGKNIINPYAVNWSKYKKSVPFVIRQKPGPDNALGLIMFLFPNSFDIYMHDTPYKGLFGESNRSFSHGCIRLEKAEKLAKYIFRNDKSITDDKMKKWRSEGIETHIPVHPPMPVFIVYFTAWVDNSGRMNFRNDIYGLDDKLANEIFAK
jgi:murein L,D-transpeptidase YcbB/YkuD